MATQPTTVKVETFLETVSDKRREESHALIAIMQDITGDKPHMWGPSIVAFGSQHYKYDTGRVGDMPRLAFSPRKASITVYFSEGFYRYGELLTVLGKHKQSVSCLYLNSLDDIKLNILREMLKQSYELGANPVEKPTSVEEYIASIPAASRPQFDELRKLVKNALPHANEVLSYGIVGYRIDDKRARVYISGWKDHTAMYPIPKSEKLQAQLAPYSKGKGTLWFGLTEPLPKPLIKTAIKALVS